MYLIRTAFWISVVVLCLPIGADDPADASAAGAAQSDVTASATISAALSTVSDFAGLCDRQPEVCETGSAMWHTFQRKALHGANLIYDWAQGSDSADALGQDVEPQLRESQNDHGAPALPTQLSAGELHTGSIIRLAGGSKKSQNTLKIEDLIPEWKGPGMKTRA